MLTEAVPQRFLTLQQAAAYVGLSERSIRRMIDANRLIAFRPTRTVLIDRKQLEKVVFDSARA